MSPRVQPQAGPLGLDDQHRVRADGDVVDIALAELDAVESPPAATELVSIELTEKGHRAVGHWPSPDSYEDLLRVLDDKIAATQDPEERSRLARFRDGALALGTKVGSELLTAWVRSQTGI